MYAIKLYLLEVFEGGGGMKVVFKINYPDSRVSEFLFPRKFAEIRSLFSDYCDVGRRHFFKSVYQL